MELFGFGKRIRDGLFYINQVKGIDDRESGYDDVEDK